MRRSVWELVDRYDATLRLVAGHVVRMREMRPVPLTLWAWELVLQDMERLREQAAVAAEKCEGRRAS